MVGGSDIWGEVTHRERGDAQGEGVTRWGHMQGDGHRGNIWQWGRRR